MNAPQESSDEWIVEVSAEIADRAEEVLREFATDAELDLALIVDIGGGLVSGVATRPDVEVDTVGALVAGAFGAMRALAGGLGESNLVESVHHGARDIFHLRDIDGRFILLGLTERALPAGLIREKAAQISARLADLLAESVEPAEDGGERLSGVPEAASPSPFEKVEEKPQQSAAAAKQKNETGSVGETPKAVPPQAETNPQPPAATSDPPESERKKTPAEGKDTPGPTRGGTDEEDVRPKDGKYVFEIR